MSINKNAKTKIKPKNGIKLTYQTYGERKNDWLIGISGPKEEVERLHNCVYNFNGTDSQFNPKTDNFATLITTKERFIRFLSDYYQFVYGENCSKIKLKKYIDFFMNKIQLGRVV